MAIAFHGLALARVEVPHLSSVPGRGPRGGIIARLLSVFWREHFAGYACPASLVEPRDYRMVTSAIEPAIQDAAARDIRRPIRAGPVLLTAVGARVRSVRSCSSRPSDRRPIRRAVRALQRGSTARSGCRRGGE